MPARTCAGLTGVALDACPSVRPNAGVDVVVSRRLCAHLSLCLSRSPAVGAPSLNSGRGVATGRAFTNPPATRTPTQPGPNAPNARPATNPPHPNPPTPPGYALLSGSLTSRGGWGVGGWCPADAVASSISAAAVSIAPAWATQLLAGKRSTESTASAGPTEAMAPRTAIRPGVVAWLVYAPQGLGQAAWGIEAFRLKRLRLRVGVGARAGRPLPQPPLANPTKPLFLQSLRRSIVTQCATAHARTTGYG